MTSTPSPRRAPRRKPTRDLAPCIDPSISPSEHGGESVAERRRRVEALLCELARNHQRPWQLWAPWMAVMLGLRAGEVMASRTTDLVPEGDRWYWCAHPHERGQMPEARQRIIPIPQAFIDAGFLSFVQACPMGLLFPELSRSQGSRFTLEQYVRSRALASADPSLHAMRFGDLRLAAADALRGTETHLLAAAVFLGSSCNELWAEVSRSVEAWRAPHRLNEVVAAATFPDLTAAIRVSQEQRPTQNARRFRWAGQREVSLTPR